MKKVLILVLAILLALPFGACGEGMDVPVDAFIQRAGIEADAGLREKIADFLQERNITEPILQLIDDGRIARYASHLMDGLPIDYAFMTSEDSQPMPEGAKIAQMAVLFPQGAAMESLLVDFERALVYYDETFPVTEDVCRAEYAAPLTDADAEKLLALLDGVTMQDQMGEMPGVELSAIRVIAAWEGGVTRCMAAGTGVSEDFLDGVQAMLDAGRAVAQGGDA